MIDRWIDWLGSEARSELYALGWCRARTRRQAGVRR